MGIPRAQSLDQDRPASRVWLWAIAVAAAAFLFRLVPVLRGGGLFGLGNYDDGVYYASATGLIHGLVPYRDFVFLHPPAITVLLAPFAAVAQLTSDSYGFAAARVAWMLLGAANAVLIWKILRPVGPVAAAFGGFCYAVFYPAIYSDKSTLLESPATTALLIVILLLQPLARADSLPHGKALIAGALLGLAMTIKIWGVITLLIVLGWLLLLRRYDVALRVLIACAATTTVICLPFFVAAPTAMWNQIVRDQLFRGVSSVTSLERLEQIVGLSIIDRAYPPAITVAAVVALLGCAALAWSYREARLPVLLMLGQGLYLLVVSIWFPHFAGFTAAPIALTAGAAVSRLMALLRARPARIAVGVLAAGAMLLYASDSATVTFNRQLPDQFRALTVATPGCVTSDDATALVATDTLSRNLSRDCRFVADLGGHSHDLAAAAGVPVSRNRNQAFQRFALDYLRSGSVTMLIKYSGGQGFNAKTTAVLKQWPLLASSGRLQVRQPVALDQPGGTR